LYEARHLILDGNLQDIPNLAGADFERAVTIHGLYSECVIGKLTKRVVPRVRIDPMLRLKDKEQKMYADVMHVDGKVSYICNQTIEYNNTFPNLE
jgi:hypothetical protein